MGKGSCLAAAVPCAIIGDECDDFDLSKRCKALFSAIRSLTALHEVKPSPLGGTRAKPASGPSSSIVSWDEISQHCSADSCWIVIKDKVYDVTDFVPEHPGGRAILSFAGRDATDVFATFHASATWHELERFYICDVQTPTTDALLSDFRALRLKLIRKGLFAGSLAYYAWKCASNLALFFTAAGILLSNDSWGACVLAALVLGVAWQQSGWLAHDFLHHQVFKDRRLNNIFGLFFGNVVQGFSVDWWKNKHNTHHAVPNACTPNADPLDPDIDTLPLLAWHEDMLKGMPKAQTELVRYQQYIFFPVLCFARMSWAQQSFSHALSLVSRRGVKEAALICVHYTLLLSLAFSSLSPLKAVAFLLLSQILAGFMLALVFVQSHNGMEVYLEAKDFVMAQIVSTRDVTSSLWMDWFTGGLNYQLEHHLFPTLPRHNLGKVKPEVEAFCARHKLPYESCDMSTGTFRVLHRLAEIAAKA